MSDYKAPGYTKTAISSQANQIVCNRHVWDVTVQAANDKVFIGKLPAGHRVNLKDVSIFANANCPAVNFDLVIADETVFDGQAVTASTATLASTTNDADLAELEETIGVDFDTDRDIYLLINSGAATAPAGAKVIAKVPSYPVGTAD